MLIAWVFVSANSVCMYERSTKFIFRYSYTADPAVLDSLQMLSYKAFYEEGAVQTSKRDLAETQSWDKKTSSWARQVFGSLEVFTGPNVKRRYLRGGGRGACMPKTLVCTALWQPVGFGLGGPADRIWLLG